MQIPTANDIPVDFRVTLLRNAPCDRTPMVHSSKAVGEPPFFLGKYLGRSGCCVRCAVPVLRSCGAVGCDAGCCSTPLPCAGQRIDAPLALRLLCAAGMQPRCASWPSLPPAHPF